MPALFADDLPAIVQAGVAAPSPDNRHCFEVRASQHGILLYGDETHLSDPYHRRVLNLISFGAVVENMVVRAAGLGYRSTVNWFPDVKRPALVAELQLAASTPDEGKLVAAIDRRHTNRRLLFSGPRLGALELERFRELASMTKGVSLAFLDASAERSRLLGLVRMAEAERFNTREMHADLFSAVRFDVGWRATSDSGLPPGALSVEPGMRWAFAQLRHWPVMNVLRRLGVHHALGLRAASLPCRLAPHCGVLTTPLPVEQGAPLVGRVLERLWLAAESLGLAFQPLAGAALLALPGYRDVPLRTGERLRRGWREFTRETPLMVFRMGRAKRPGIRTGRPPLASVLRA